MPQGAPTSAELEARAAFFLCLGRAFLVPTQTMYTAAKAGLVADLRELAAESGYDCDELIDELETEVLAVEGPDTLLVTYARLFVTPGESHPSLNAGAYLDGAVGGGSVKAIASLYRRCGLQMHDCMRDLPDLVPVQLEFIGWLNAAEAECIRFGSAPPPVLAATFMNDYVARWITPFRIDIEAATLRFGLGGHPYATLARLVEQASQAQSEREAITEPRSNHCVPDSEIQALRARFVHRSLDAIDLATIRERLVAAGLDASHVDVPIERRDRAMGVVALDPPGSPSRGGTIRRP